MSLLFGKVQSYPWENGKSEFLYLHIDNQLLPFPSEMTVPIRKLRVFFFLKGVWGRKDYDHSDSRYYRPGVFCLSKGLYIEVGGVFNAFFRANLESEVGFLKFLLLLSRF